MMKFAVPVFPGSNCDHDMVNALRDILHVTADLIPATATSLAGYDAVVLPGGFSYGDYLRSGAIARFAPIMPAVIAFANAGKPVIGICNGFQVLTEAGLLPGALQANRSAKFICQDSPLRIANHETIFTTAYGSTDQISLPIAHGEAIIIVMRPPWRNYVLIIKSSSNTSRIQMAARLILLALQMKREMCLG